jgi:hypothetical protein
MNRRPSWKRGAQLAVILLCALALKLYYSTASPDQLRWILAPTTFLVELVSGRSFEFESNAGYLSSDRTFLIAASCAGVNFLITSFLMLSLRKLWGGRLQDQADNRSGNLSSNLSGHRAWRFIPVAAVFAYLAMLVANAVRISIALQMQRTPVEIGRLSPNQLHRFEGIFIYFGFLLLLFVLSEKWNPQSASNLSTHGRSGLLRRSLFPLLIYYITTLGIPLANSAYHERIAATDFWEHSVYVLLTPLLLILPLVTFRSLLAQPWRGRLRYDEEVKLRQS